MTDKHVNFINSLSDQIHADCVAAGWWDDPDRCVFTCLQLVSSEIAEAMEGARKDLWDDHLEGFKMEEVEYADAMIRVLDLGGKLKLNYGLYNAYAHDYCDVNNHVGKQQLGINAVIIQLAGAIEDFAHSDNATARSIMNIAYSDLIKSILQVAFNRGFALYEAMELKLEYNKTRKDHTREERAKENGKKF